jgi:hypothetical protein
VCTAEAGSPNLKLLASEVESAIAAVADEPSFEIGEAGMPLVGAWRAHSEGNREILRSNSLMA